MSSQFTDTDRQKYMDEMKTFIYSDLKVAVSNNANYLAALGMSTYTEILGGLYCGDLRNDLGCHYIIFIRKYFPPEYDNYDRMLRDDELGGLYGAVRSGLVHEFFIKISSTISNGGLSSKDCGIVYDRGGATKIEFDIARYYTDFQKAFEQYYDELILQNKQQLTRDFDRAINGMRESPFAPVGGTTSGTSPLARTSGATSTTTLSSQNRSP